MASGSSEAAFGVFDGIVSVIGLIVGLLATSETTIIRGAVGLAVASAFGMAAGEYLGDEERNLKMAFVMGGATAVGTMGPVAAFLVLPKVAATVVALLIALALCGAIASFRSRFQPPLRAWTETYLILVGATTVTVVTSLLTGAVG